MKQVPVSEMLNTVISSHFTIKLDKCFQNSPKLYSLVFFNVFNDI